MIYIISDKEEKFDLNPIYRFGTRQMVLDFLDSCQEFIPLDLETRGLDAHVNRLLSLGVGDKDNQYIVDVESMADILWLKSHLESKTILTHGGKFDVKYLFKYGIYCLKVWDNFLAEKIINCGIDYIRNALDAVTKRYLSIELDKSTRVNIPKVGLIPRVISYAADDIKYMPEIRLAQIKKLEENDLLKVLSLENSYLPALAYIELCGFKLDADKWRIKMTKDEERLDECIKRLNKWIIDNGHSKYINNQVDMFSEKTISTINWSSPIQVVKFFDGYLKIDCSVKVSGIIKKSVEDSVINKYKDSHEIVKLYLEFKKAEKITTTYGQNFIDQINPKTGRLHTKFNQIMHTGRTSSGGKDNAAKVVNINFQNIPRNPETRAAFVAEEGNTLIIADYMGQEKIVLANQSLDPGLLEFYDKDLGDMHSFVASKAYSELSSLSLKEIKEHHSDKRDGIKAASFSIDYGGVGKTISDNLNISVEEGEALYNAYFTAFPGLKPYFEKVKKQGLEDGYIKISDVTGRKCFIPDYDKFVELHNKMDKKYWATYREEKANNSENFFWLKKEVSTYFKIKGDIERMSLNYRIQGVSGEITKLATIFTFRYIMENNLFWIVKICNTIHDELVLECPISMAEDLAKKVKGFMEKAGSYYCKRIKLTTTPKISPYWQK